MNESFRSVLAADEELDVRDDELLDEDPRDRHVSSQRSYSVPPHSAALVRARRHVRPGEVVAGKYRVERRIADSGLATLLQVRHLVLDEAATLKYLRPEALAFPDAVGDFLTGARRLSQVRSEHVARVLDVGMLDFGPPYMVTEQPEGPDLAQVIKVRGALPVPEAIDYISQACLGVAAAHDLGVIHGGLSTENIFVCRSADGSPIIRIVGFTTSSTEATDLGSAGAGMLSMASVPPSLRYLSPEHARDPGHLDVRTDVWTLGAILYELLTGQPVFEDRTVPGLLAKIVADSPTPLRNLRRDIPENLERALLRCLRKSRDDRFQSVHALREALKEAARISEPPAAQVHTRLDERDTQRPEARSWDTSETPSSRTPPPLPVANSVASRVPPLFVTTQPPPAPSVSPVQEPILLVSPVISAAPGSSAPPISAPAISAVAAPAPSMPAHSQQPAHPALSSTRSTNMWLAALAIGVLALLAFEVSRSSLQSTPVAAEGTALGAAPHVAPEHGSASSPAAQPVVAVPPPAVTAVPTAASIAAAPAAEVQPSAAPQPAAPPPASAPVAAAKAVTAPTPNVTVPRPKKRAAQPASEPAAEEPAPKVASKKDVSASAAEPKTAPKKAAAGTARAGLFDDQWWQ